ncbi:vacuolar-sorting receptor 1-like isoform X2 [Aristolochia californica]|uniref:vacuolar-sorting receptor 1-like isoform X2 n=1 Tax=Aristolochia californica TaxID=171875 RepID=UPI0035DD52FD
MDSPQEDEASAKYIQNITIPSALISRNFGEKLKKAIASGEMVNVNFDWREAVPHPENWVEYELWTNSHDERGPQCDMLMQFVTDFKGATQLLEQGGYSQFTPHYIPRLHSPRAGFIGFALPTAMPILETITFLKSGKFQPTDFDAIFCSSGSAVYYPGINQHEDDGEKISSAPDYASHIDYCWGYDGLTKTISQLLHTH